MGNSPAGNPELHVEPGGDPANDPGVPGNHEGPHNDNPYKEEKTMAELEAVYAKQYGANIYEMAHQKESILRNFVTLETMTGEKRHFDRVHPTEAVRVDSKYGDTPLIPTEFDRRTVHAREYVWADMIDWQDNLNLFIDPTSRIVQMGAHAMGVIIDKIIIKSAFGGYAFEGKDGLDPVAFPETQKIPVTVGGTGSVNTGLNIEKLIQTRSKFGKADIDLDDPANELHIAVTQSQLDDLARSVDYANRDYNAIQDLYHGKCNTFMGFNFHRCGRLEAAAADGGLIRTCAAWVKSGVVLVVPQEIKMTVNTRPDKNNNWQAHAVMKAGATRIEDEKVQQIFCYEAE